MTDQERAREIRDKKLCGTSVCQFDAGCGCLEAIVSLISAVREETRRVLKDRVRHEIDAFQDIIGWQPEESRNRLVCDIRDKIDRIILDEGDRHEGR